MTETDQELLEAARAGEEAAFAELCRRYEDQAKRVVQRRLGARVRRRVSVADVLQETWLVAHDQLADFENRGNGAFGRWVTAIAKRKALDEVKRHVQVAKRSARAELTGAAKPRIDDLRGRGPTPSQVAVAEELGESVRKAVGTLRPEQREVLFLVQKERLTLQEAADRTGRTRDSVKGLYSRALKALARALDRDGARGS